MYTVRIYLQFTLSLLFSDASIYASVLTVQFYVCMHENFIIYIYIFLYCNFYTYGRLCVYNYLNMNE